MKFQKDSLQCYTTVYWAIAITLPLPLSLTAIHCHNGNTQLRIINNNPYTFYNFKVLLENEIIPGTAGVQQQTNKQKHVDMTTRTNPST